MQVRKNPGSRQPFSDGLYERFRSEGMVCLHPDGFVSQCQNGTRTDIDFFRCQG